MLLVDLFLIVLLVDLSLSLSLSLSVSGNGLSAVCMAAMSNLFAQRHVIKTLVKLDLSYNPLGVEGSKGIHMV